MTARPVIDNAPGLVWKRRKSGWNARWQARSDLRQRGFEPAEVNLWLGTEADLTERLAGFIRDRCNLLQAEMLVWGRGGIPMPSAFDGSLRSLAACFQSDPDSTYQKLRFVTRKFYDRLIKRLVNEYGDLDLSELKARNFLRMHEGWTGDGKVAMGHAMVGMVRTLAGFGATILEDAECERISGVLHNGAESAGKGGYAGRRQEDDVNLVATTALAFQPRFARNDRGAPSEIAHALTSEAGRTGKGDSAQCVVTDWMVRRLTPLECERLQGFGDGYTAIDRKGKPAADGPRYKALGNSMAVNAMRWLGTRIELINALAKVA